jgi:membrane protein
MTSPDHRSPDLRHVRPEQWRRVVLQTGRDLWSVNVLEWASSLAFYGFVSTFPLVVGLLIVTSSIADPEWVAQNATSLLGKFLPEGGPETGKILEAAVVERGRIGFLSLVIFFISGRRVLGVLTKALNKVSDVHRQEVSALRRLGTELALLVGLVSFGLLALFVRPLLDVLWTTAEVIPGPDDSFVHGVAVGVRALLILITFCLVYAFVPFGKRLWRAVLVGAGTATVLVLLAERIFDRFAERIWTNMGLLYGPLALAAVLMSWIWCVAVITLVGGGLASHVKVMILERQSAQRAHHLHVEA